MWRISKRAQMILAITCCCIVLLAATAHLLHIHSQHNHGKAVADVACSLCMFSAQAAGPIVHVLPPLKTLLDHNVVVPDERIQPAEFFRMEIGRAPPSIA